MTSQEFVSTLQGYFYREKPTAYFLATIREYVEKLTPSHRQTLLRLALKNCAFLPTIYDLEKLEEKIPPAPRLALSEPPLTNDELAETRRLIKELRGKYPVEDSGTNAGSYIGGILEGAESKVKLEQAKRELRLVRVDKAAG